MLLCNISRKEWEMKLIFHLQINGKGLFKLILSFWVCVVRYAQITQNNKFAISLQYLKKAVSDEVDFFHAVEYETLIQPDTMILMGMVKHSQSSQIATLQCLYNISKKKLGMKLIVCKQIHIKVPYKLISTLWASQFHTRWYYHYWWAWSSILKVVKVTSLQYLYNISKKKLGIEFIFLHIDKHQSF